MLDAAEASGTAKVEVDEEGSAKVAESKTRFIAPVLSYLVALKAADSDGERTGAGEANAGGRTLGGASGLGLVGAAAAQSSKTLGSVLGFYGLGWSVYTNIIARGAEVEFQKNAAIDIRFGSRSGGALKFVSSTNFRSVCDSCKVSRTEITRNNKRQVQ